MATKLASDKLLSPMVSLSSSIVLLVVVHRQGELPVAVEEVARDQTVGGVDARVTLHVAVMRHGPEDGHHIPGEVQGGELCQEEAQGLEG